MLSPGKASCDRVAPPILRCMLGVFGVSITHRTLTWTTGSLTCAQVLVHAIAHGSVQTRVRESALKIDSERKIPCRTGESNLRQRRARLMLYQLSYIPTPSSKNCLWVFVWIAITYRIGKKNLLRFETSASWMAAVIRAYVGNDPVVCIVLRQFGAAHRASSNY